MEITKKDLKDFEEMEKDYLLFQYENPFIEDKNKTNIGYIVFRLIKAERKIKELEKLLHGI